MNSQPQQLVKTQLSEKYKKKIKERVDTTYKRLAYNVYFPLNHPQPPHVSQHTDICLRFLLALANHAVVCKPIRDKRKTHSQSVGKQTRPAVL